MRQEDFIKRGALILVLHNQDRHPLLARQLIRAFLSIF